MNTQDIIELLDCAASVIDADADANSTRWLNQRSRAFLVGRLYRAAEHLDATRGGTTDEAIQPT